MKIPVVSRLYLTGAFMTTAACAVDIISPLSLYFNYDLVFRHGQFWRLITPYLFFGVFSVDFIFHMYFLVCTCLEIPASKLQCVCPFRTHSVILDFLIFRMKQVQYSRLLEEGDFRGRRAHYVWMLLFGIVNISLLASFGTNLHFLGHALTFMMTYVWGRRNPDVKMVFLGLLQFNAPYLPWVMLTFSALLGHSITMDLIGICVGHVYYYLEWVFPVMAEVRGWKIRRVTDPPMIFQWLCGTVDTLHFPNAALNDLQDDNFHPHRD
jgi:Derlin-2/3